MKDYVKSIQKKWWISYLWTTKINRSFMQSIIQIEQASERYFQRLHTG